MLTPCVYETDCGAIEVSHRNSTEYVFETGLEYVLVVAVVVVVDVVMETDLDSLWKRDLCACGPPRCHRN